MKPARHEPPVEDPDLVLARAWQAGDRAAGEALFDRYFAALSRFFRNKCRDRPDDLIQTTMLALVEGRPGFRGEGSFRSYVFGVAYNVLRNHYRAARRAPEIDPSLSSVFDLGAGPSTACGVRAEQQLLLDALRRIPLEHQVVLELFYWEPLTAGEIAEVLGIPEGTVRTRLRRARTLLEGALRRARVRPGLLRSTTADLEGWARSLHTA